MQNVAYFGGSFDLFHVGHLRTLKEARKIADNNNAKLIIGVNTDEIYKDHKSRSPIIGYEHRREIIESFGFIDEVVPQDDLTTTSVLRRYGANIYIICSEYADSKEDERSYISSINGLVIELPYHDDVPSSTSIKEKIRNSTKK